MAYPKRLLSADEEIVREFRPHWQVLLLPIVLTLVAAALVGLAVTGLEGAARALALISIGGAWSLLVSRRLAEWFSTHYVITNERLVFRAGILARRGKEIPIEVINDVAFAQSFFERIVGSGDLLIESAGELGQSRFTDIPDPEAIQSLIYRVREDRTKSLRGAAPSSVGSELEILARLRDEGVLSAEEFERQKRKLLGTKEP